MNDTLPDNITLPTTPKSKQQPRSSACLRNTTKWSGSRTSQSNTATMFCFPKQKAWNS
ncbi:uncharacterized protein ASPGLDRAFT_43449 [Aspergillus glaucus CBS 516.65]|uniref:Uncharacterized protein n=1 Tax=Aspergillus glaucus CBS 516.65 TaxID=1160497 RepID=A0A1L9VSV6_ASPGL|nr:hypothetical protein ASPGLDRAFT_43449 [Aspergillus glaucus CBS 516.65]OJJ86974.1 hypothetical protein ASPGLDRAFT_43449 [Aspergillus glaucus CBS 516.65]